MAKQEPKEEDFFEVVPGTYIDEFNSPDDDSQIERDAKITAIVTIILTIAVAIAMGIFFLKGVDTIKSNVSQQSGQIVP
jgi:hypothetical protein